METLDLVDIYVQKEQKQLFFSTLLTCLLVSFQYTRQSAVGSVAKNSAVTRNSSRTAPAPPAPRSTENTKRKFGNIDNVDDNNDVDGAISSSNDDETEFTLSKKTLDASFPSEYHELLDMSTTDFNRYLKIAQLSMDEVMELRKARRRKKNRLYAKRSRGKKMQKLVDMNTKCEILQAAVSQLTQVHTAPNNVYHP